MDDAASRVPRRRHSGLLGYGLAGCSLRPISAGVFGADQRVTRLEALRAATEGYAYLTFSEDERGSLEVGKLADLAVTAMDYLTCADPCLESMQVDLTVVGGRIVWER